ncbi:MAG: hypothetical protein PHG85_07070 [Candidatus Altiarchaeota archaeon]|nr:hypothetical protein [Candidatus Altiarchaeota archaeon]
MCGRFAACCACIILVLSCGCLGGGSGGGSTTTTLPAVYYANCSSLEGMVKALMAESNHCADSSDCVVSGVQPGCPFGCYVLANRNASLEDIHKYSEAYNDACPHCEYKCMTPPAGANITCIDGKCADARYVATSTQASTTTTTLYRMDDEGCRQLRYQMRDLLEKSNYCTADDDCIVPALQLECPFGCYLIMNRNASISSEVVHAISKASYDYQKVCPKCEQICFAPPEADDLKCRHGRCADVRFDILPSSDWTFRLDVNDSLPKTVIVYGNGTVSYTEGGTTRSAAIAPERVQSLKQSAIDGGFFSLNGAYAGTGCCDFIAHEITISSGGRTVRVYCYNECPAGFNTLKDALKEAWPGVIAYRGFA